MAETAELMRTLLPEFSSLARERIWTEWEKLALTSHPAAGLRVLLESGWIMAFPELAALRGVPQEPRWHPEGDVWTHSVQAAQHAASLAEDVPGHDSAFERKVLFFGALLHDVGKPETTVFGHDGVIRSNGHAEAGVVPASAFLRAIGAPTELVAHVLPLVREHMVYVSGEPTPRAVRRLALRLQPAGIDMLCLVARADASARPPATGYQPDGRLVSRGPGTRCGCASTDATAVGPAFARRGACGTGPALGEWLRQTYAAQVDGEFDDLATDLSWLRRQMLDRAPEPG